MIWVNINRCSRVPHNKRAGAALSSIFSLIVLVMSGWLAERPAMAWQAAIAGPALQVSVSTARHPISPYIYGINFAEESLAKELRLPVRRWGGNATTRYNYKINMSNHAADWYFENLVEAGGSPTTLPDGSAADLFIDQDRRTGTRTLMTVPLMGWIPQARKCGFSVAKYGAQQKTDPYWSDCGNGVKPDGTNITGNDPLDTSAEIGPDFVQEWVRYLVARYGSASQGGVQFYDLDNEPDWWFGTHRDVHPDTAGYDEIRDRAVLYGPAIKAADPAALTLGPVSGGWWSALYTAKDWVAGWKVPPYFWNSNPVDRKAHGDIPFAEWYLQQMQAYQQQHGVRILDMLDLHFYSQAANVSDAALGDSNLQNLRLRNTRVLWDPTYKDESPINDYVRLIPRMHEWVNQDYPGTRLAITEYNWGALKYLNGALAQADILGIFGRERLDLATLWGPEESDQPWAYAFRMYRNYDGSGSAFGDVSVQASSADQNKLAIYVAQRSSDSALTIMVINKSGDDLNGTVALSGFVPAGTAKVYRYGAANLKSVAPQPDQTLTGSGFSATFPASSITLLVAPSAAEPISMLFAHIAAGGGFATTITITNTGGDAASGTLYLTDKDGQALPVTFTDSQGGSLSSSTYPISLSAGGSMIVTAARSGAADIKSGSARVESTGGTLTGVATFQWTDGTKLKSIAGVLSALPVNSAVIPVDNDGGSDRYTGFAVANSGSSDVHLTIAVLREDGLVVDQEQPAELNPLAAGKQVARFLHEYKADWTTFRGSIQITAQAGENFAVVALVQNKGQFTAVPVAGQKPPWRLVWNDEFNGPDGSAVDSTKWVFEQGNNNGWGNSELEYYTDHLTNAHVEGGSLVITANKESIGTYQYTSARMKTQGKFTQKYGRFEARIKLPQGQGMWPAFWMLGDNINQAGWPTCGELDIMENIGKEPSIVHGTIHGPGYSGAQGLGGLYTLPSPQKFADDYHIFAVEWDPDAIRWYVDGNLYSTHVPADVPGKTWVFDHPFFILLNLAVGGGWPGNPDSTTQFPQKMLVDYARVYERVP